jgi:hypothetical protein
VNARELRNEEVCSPLSVVSCEKSMEHRENEAGGWQLAAGSNFSSAGKVFCCQLQDSFLSYSAGTDYGSAPGGITDSALGTAPLMLEFGA